MVKGSEGKISFAYVYAQRRNCARHFVVVEIAQLKVTIAGIVVLLLVIIILSVSS
eukprot:COSAG02_NODE_46033_length_352_cov_0.806324_1_plen_55_part_00